MKHTQNQCKHDGRYWIDKKLVEDSLKDDKKETNIKFIRIEDIENLYSNRGRDTDKIFSVNSLLSIPTNNRFKISSDKKIYTLNLLPSFKNTCPNAGNCEDICVGVSRQGKLQNFKFLIRTLYLFNYDKNFECLKQEIKNKLKYYKNKDIILYFRLNNYSDISWTIKKRLGLDFYKEIYERYKDKVKFYDYTKNLDMFEKFLNKTDWPENYYLSYSYDKKNDTDDKKNKNKENFKKLIQSLNKKNFNRLSVSFIVDRDTKDEFSKKTDNLFVFIDGDKNDIRADDFEKYQNKIKIVLLEYNTKTGLKKDEQNESKYYLNKNELKEKLEEIKNKYDSLSKH